MGEYHFVQYPGYYGKWYDPVCNYRYNGQGASLSCTGIVEALYGADETS